MKKEMGYTGNCRILYVPAWSFLKWHSNNLVPIIEVEVSVETREEDDTMSYISLDKVWRKATKSEANDILYDTDEFWNWLN